MIDLTREDWCEIYNALITKSLIVRKGWYQPEDQPGEDARWIEHLEAIKRKIGQDGMDAFESGVAASELI